MSFEDTDYPYIVLGGLFSCTQMERFGEWEPSRYQYKHKRGRKSVVSESVPSVQRGRVQRTVRNQEAPRRLVNVKIIFPRLEVSKVAVHHIENLKEEYYG